MKPYFGHFSIFLDFNINFLKIDSINLFVAIHQWKEESLSFPTRYGTSMAYFFRNNTSLDNMCIMGAKRSTLIRLYPWSGNHFLKLPLTPEGLSQYIVLKALSYTPADRGAKHKWLGILRSPRNVTGIMTLSFIHRGAFRSKVLPGVTCSTSNCSCKEFGILAEGDENY